MLPRGNCVSARCYQYLPLFAKQLLPTIGRVAQKARGRLAAGVVAPFAIGFSVLSMAEMAAGANRLKIIRRGRFAGSSDFRPADRRTSWPGF